MDCRPPGQSVGRWKQLNIAEATHLPFVQVLTGFTRPERGIIDQREYPSVLEPRLLPRFFFCPADEENLKFGPEFVNKVEILRLFSPLPLERQGGLEYNAEIRAEPGRSSNQREE